MANMFRISEAASLGMHMMALLAGSPGRLLTAREAAITLRASEAHLSKVLQRLSRAGLVRSARGPGGGFTLSRGDITLLEVFEAVEGPLDFSGCLLSRPVCGKNRCIMGGLIESTNLVVRKYLANTRVSELAGVYERESDAS